MQLAEFEDAGPVIPNIDMDLLMRSRIGGAPLPGEVLQITMPAILHVITADEPLHATDTYACRVSESGTITLPAVGEIEVAEKTLVEIESAIVDAYYPEYATTRPAVFVDLVEQMENPLFTVIGLVNNPGNYPYAPDTRFNVMQAIGAAGGVGEGEPHYVHVYRLTPDEAIVSATFKIANTGDDSELADAMTTVIKPGDIVDVARTARTRINAIVDNMFHFSTGAYWDISGDDRR
jgi:protein involved in polysaccharide export with SLBB domain